MPKRSLQHDIEWVNLGYPHLQTGYWDMPSYELPFCSMRPPGASFVSKQREPFMRSTSCLVTAKPMPLPSNSRTVDPSAYQPHPRVLGCI